MKIQQIIPLSGPTTLNDGVRVLRMDGTFGRIKPNCKMEAIALALVSEWGKQSILPIVAVE